MSAVDLIRMGFAGMASIGAAAGGFAASQSPTDVVGVAVPQPPNLEFRTFRADPGPISYTLQEWDAGLMLPAVAAVQAQPEERPWRFVGVIGEGQSARAVFAAPDGSSRTLMVQVGDTLPDGRVIAAVASEHVLFGSMRGRPGQVAAATGIVGPSQIALFSGGNGNAEATAAFEQQAQQAALAVAPTVRAVPVAPNAVGVPNGDQFPDFGGPPEPASAPTN